MKRASVLVALAAGILLAHLAMRWLGLAAHTSILAGMPQSDASIVIGPLYVLVHLLAVTAAPILALASVLDAAASRLRLRRS